MNKNQNSKKELHPFTEKSLLERAIISNKDYLEGRFMSQDELEILSREW